MGSNLGVIKFSNSTKYQSVKPASMWLCNTILKLPKSGVLNANLQKMNLNKKSNLEIFHPIVASQYWEDTTSRFALSSPLLCSLARDVTVSVLGDIRKTRLLVTLGLLVHYASDTGSCKFWDSETLFLYFLTIHMWTIHKCLKPDFFLLPPNQLWDLLAWLYAGHPQSLSKHQ